MVIFLNFFGQRAKKSWASVKFIWAGLSKLDFKFQRKLSGKNFSAKITNCYFVFEYRAEKSRLNAGKNSAGTSKCFLPVLWNILKKSYIENFLHILSNSFGLFPVIEQ